MDVRRKAYSMYQMDWMLRHGITLAGIDEVVSELFHLKAQDPEDKTTFSEYIEEYGFSGMIWVCFEEFLECEYQDASYIKMLLSEADYAVYLQDRKNLDEHSESAHKTEREADKAETERDDHHAAVNRSSEETEKLRAEIASLKKQTDSLKKRTFNDKELSQLFVETLAYCEKLNYIINETAKEIVANAYDPKSNAFRNAVKSHGENAADLESYQKLGARLLSVIADSEKLTTISR